MEASKNVRKEKILNEFNSYCKELVVLGFNSASYDLNLIKSTLIQILLKDIQFVIKRTNSYLCLKTRKLQFRSHEIENSETVKKVLGLDANSLYLHAIAQNNPTGYFCCYKEEEDFRPDPCSKFGFQSLRCL